MITKDRSDARVSSEPVNPLNDGVIVHHLPVDALPESRVVFRLHL